jgi:hypothetical protein
MLFDINSPMLDIGGHDRKISVLGCFDSKAFVRVDSKRRQSGQGTRTRPISELYLTDGTQAGTSLIWHRE